MKKSVLSHTDIFIIVYLLQTSKKKRIMSIIYRYVGMYIMYIVRRKLTIIPTHLTTKLSRLYL